MEFYECLCGWDIQMKSKFFFLWSWCCRFYVDLMTNLCINLCRSHPSRWYKLQWGHTRRSMVPWILCSMVVSHYYYPFLILIKHITTWNQQYPYHKHSGHCKNFAPIYEEASNDPDLKDIKFAAIDVTSEKDLDVQHSNCMFLQYPRLSL